MVKLRPIYLLQEPQTTLRLQKERQLIYLPLELLELPTLAQLEPQELRGRQVQSQLELLALLVEMPLLEQQELPEQLVEMALLLV